MTLMSQEISKLATAIAQELNIPALTMIASTLNVPLPNLAPGATLFESALRLINHLNAETPPRDRELLALLGNGPNPTLRALALDLQRPSYFSPTADPHDAIVLGTTAFVARDALRASLRKFTAFSPYTTRVLIVRGSEPGGKTFSWEFLRHLAFYSAGALAMRLRLRNTRYTPRQFVAQAMALLGLDPAVLPPDTDAPQLSVVDPFINAFKGQLVNLEQSYWLVVDDLNDPSVTPEILSAAYALALAVEEQRPQKLWLALLGYNEEITDHELHAIALDDAEFPDAALVARHFDVISSATPKPLPAGRAREIADLLFTKFPRLDKEAMSKLTRLVEDAGAKLQQGIHP